MKRNERSLKKSLKKKTKSDLCIECQECCKILRIPVGRFLDLDSRVFYSARGIDIVQHDGVLWFVIPHVCRQLTDKGCRIYEHRPQACRVYDGRTDPVVNCKWKELEEE